MMDKAPWRKKAKRLIENEQEYAVIRKKLSIVSLPPYSLDLNSIEQGWRVTHREKTHKRYWKNLDIFTATFDDWSSSSYYRVVVYRAPVQELCYTVGEYFIPPAPHH